MFRQLFMPTIDKIMDVFDPGAVILQCGADSLAADRLGSWALSIRGAPVRMPPRRIPFLCVLAIRSQKHRSWCVQVMARRCGTSRASAGPCW